MRCTMLVLLLLAPRHGEGFRLQESLPLTIAEGPSRAFWIGGTTAVTLQLDNGIPSALEVIRLVRAAADRPWQVAETVRVKASDGNPMLQGPPGVETLLLIRGAGHPGYILDGPFRWPSQPATYVIHPRWRKTIRGRSSGAHTSLTWLEKDDGVASRAMCTWVDGTNWECVGVPLNATGVVYTVAPGEVTCSIPSGVLSPSGIETTRNRIGAWGRLVVVEAGGATLSKEGIRISAKRAFVSRSRPSAARLEVIPDPRIHIDSIGDGVAWVSGNEVPGDGWVEVGASDRAPTRVEVRELAEVPPDLPLRLQLQPAVTVSGRVTTAMSKAAVGAVVTLYRRARGDPGRERNPRRIVVAEVSADADGAFHFDDLAVEPYEAVAMHPAFGRGVRQFSPDGRDVDIALRSPAQVVGRVLKDGVPASGVRVAVVPDLVQFAAAADITEVRGGEANTDEDGRFAVSLASRGSSDLRIGDERTGLKRVPLGPSENQAGVIDIGTVELNTAATVTLVLEDGRACDILLTGPAGRTGMTVVRSARIGPAMSQAVVPEPGRWQVVAACGARERPVLPAWIEVSPSARDITVRLSWPQ